MGGRDRGTERDTRFSRVRGQLWFESPSWWGHFCFYSLILGSWKTHVTPRVELEGWFGVFFLSVANVCLEKNCQRLPLKIKAFSYFSTLSVILSYGFQNKKLKAVPLSPDSAVGESHSLGCCADQEGPFSPILYSWLLSFCVTERGHCVWNSASVELPLPIDSGLMGLVATPHQLQ